MKKTKYSAEIHQRIVTAIKDGATQRAAARMVGVTAETLTIWKKRYRAFGEDVERAHAEAQVFAETSLYEMAKKGNVKAAELWLKFRHPKDWGNAATEAQLENGDDIVIMWGDELEGKRANENGRQEA